MCPGKSISRTEKRNESPNVEEVHAFKLTPLDLISKVPKHIHYVRSFVLDSDTATTNHRLSSNFAVIKFIGQRL